MERTCNKEIGSRCFRALGLALTCMLLFSTVGHAETLMWDFQPGALGYKIYYSTDSNVDVSDPNLDVGDVLAYELCTLPLDPCVAYYVRVAAYNASGEIFITSAQFYANNTPQIMSGAQAIDVMYDRATIEWTTDIPSTSVVAYGTAAAYGSEVSSSAYVTTHILTLMGLNPEITYHFMVSSFDPDNCGPGCHSWDNSPPGDLVFTTPPGPDLSPPVITSGPTVTNITDATATIEWTTDCGWTTTSMWS